MTSISTDRCPGGGATAGVPAFADARDVCGWCGREFGVRDDGTIPNHRANYALTLAYVGGLVDAMAIELQADRWRAER